MKNIGVKFQRISVATEMISQEFLIDYETKEKEEINKFKERSTTLDTARAERYPPTYRLKLNEPYTKSIDGEKIWSQIPLYGTTVIVLKPTRKEIFEKMHGFEIEDIDRLINFAKETKRIQFALDEYPTRYIHLDFLEPIFRELKPPKLIHIPLNWIVPEDEIGKLYHEMKSMVEHPQALMKIKDYMNRKYYDLTISEEVIKRGISDDLIRLKMLGYEDFIEYFARKLLEMNTTEIIFFLKAIHDMFLHAFDPFGGIISFKRETIHRLKEQFPFGSTVTGKLELPSEMGKFLNDKLKLIIPKNFDGAIELSDVYDLHDLRKVMQSLDQAIEDKKIDTIEEKSKEILLIFENIWSEAEQLRRRINIMRHAISLGIGVIGAIVTLPIGGVGGLLAGLGFEVGDKIVEVKGTYESLSEKIEKLRSKSHIIHIYDFKKKYKLL